MRNKRRLGILGIVLVALLLVILSFNGNNEVAEKNTLKEENLKGSIKAITNTAYGVVIQNTSGTDYITSYAEYNLAGMVTKRTAYDDKENMSYEAIYKYNRKSQLIRVDSKFADVLGFSKKKFIYNKKNQLIEEISYDAKNELSGKVTYTYDNKGNKISMKFADKNDEVWNKSDFFYDEKGVKTETIEIMHYKSNGSKTFQESKSRGIHTYDIRGNEILVVSSSADKYSDGEWTSKYEKEYDRFDNLIKVIYDMKDNDDFSYIAITIYVYDEQDNWIEKETFKDGVSDYRVVREIVYYLEDKE